MTIEGGKIAPTEIDRLQRVLGAAVRKICPAWLAEQHDDIVQNAVLRVIRIWDEAEEPRALRSSYLWRVAHSAVMDQIRGRRRQREDAWEDPPEITAPRSDSPEPRRAAVELHEAIDEGLAGMSRPRRHAVLLYLLGHGLRESATILGWNAKQVDNQRYRGLAELRRHLEDKGWGP